MKLIRVINLSNKKIKIGDTAIDAHKIKDFPVEEVTDEMYSDISSYVSVNVVRAFEYEKDDIGVVQQSNNPNADESVIEETSEEAPTPKRSRKK